MVQFCITHQSLAVTPERGGEFRMRRFIFFFGIIFFIKFVFFFGFIFFFGMFKFLNTVDRRATRILNVIAEKFSSTRGSTARRTLSVALNAFC